MAGPQGHGGRLLVGVTLVTGRLGYLSLETELLPPKHSINELASIL